MSFLLLPPDERVLVDGLVSEFGLKLLADDAAPGGKAHVVSAPLAALPDDLALPARPAQRPSAPTTLIFWSSEIGPIRTLGDAPPSSDPRDRVAGVIVRDSAENWADLIDLARTAGHPLRTIALARRRANPVTAGVTSGDGGDG